MSQQYHFIAGLPRAGSTMLSAILKQNPKYHASMMSPVHAMVMGLINSWSTGKEIAPLINKEQKQRLVRGIFDLYHGEAGEGSIVFDSNRAWAQHLPLLDDLFPQSKVICCVRNIAWVLDSFEKLFQQDPYEQTRLFPNDNDRSTVYTRVRALAGPNRVVGFSAQALKQAFYSQQSDKLILVDYDYLVKFPEQAMRALYQVLDEPYFEHDFNNVGFEAKEFDANLGVPGLHSVRSKIEYHRRDPIIPPDLFEEYSNSNFWYNTEGTKAQFVAMRKSDLKE